MPYNQDYAEYVEWRSDTMKHPIDRVQMSTFDCLDKTKRHCSFVNVADDYKSLAISGKVSAYFSS